MDFDTKIAIVVRDDLATWQKLNVTAFLTSGVTGADQSLLGEDYQDAVGNSYSPLLIQPIIVLSADGNTAAIGAIVYATTIAALGVFGTGQAWPDLLVASVMAALALWGAAEIFRQARHELAHG